MHERGYYYTCDRCGEHDFIQKEEISVAFPEGWRLIYYKEMCPKCAAEYDKMISNFMSNQPYFIAISD